MSKTCKKSKMLMVALGIAVICFSSLTFTACAGGDKFWLDYTLVTIAGVEGYEVVGQTDTYADRESVMSIVVPAEYNNKPVISLGKNAFYDYSSLEKLSIPDTIIRIQTGAFQGCSKLKYNEYDNGVYLGNETNPYVVLWKGNSKTSTSCEIHEKTQMIADMAFYQYGLTEIDIPSEVKIIGSEAFAYCKFTSVTIPNNVKRMDGGIFYNCNNLTQATIESGIDSICASMFSECIKLQSVTIPDTVKSIGDRAFYNCRQLTGVEIPAGVTNIGKDAFYGCSKLNM